MWYFQQKCQQKKVVSSALCMTLNSNFLVFQLEPNISSNMFKVNFWNHVDKYNHSKTKVLHKVQKFPDFVHEYYKTIDLQQGLAVDIPPDVQDDPRTQRVKWGRLAYCLLCIQLFCIYFTILLYPLVPCSRSHKYLHSET